MLFQIELILNNVPLIYIYPNTIEKNMFNTQLFVWYLTRWLLLSSNPTSSVAANLTVLSSTTD